jgi:hypothetical protein
MVLRLEDVDLSTAGKCRSDAECPALARCYVGVSWLSRLPGAPGSVCACNTYYGRAEYSSGCLALGTTSYYMLVGDSVLCLACLALSCWGWWWLWRLVRAFGRGTRLTASVAAHTMGSAGTLCIATYAGLIPPTVLLRRPKPLPFGVPLVLAVGLLFCAAATVTVAWVEVANMSLALMRPAQFSAYRWVATILGLLTFIAVAIILALQQWGFVIVACIPQILFVTATSVVGSARLTAMLDLVAENRPAGEPASLDASIARLGRGSYCAVCCEATARWARFCCASLVPSRSHSAASASKCRASTISSGRSTHLSGDESRRESCDSRGRAWSGSSGDSEASVGSADSELESSPAKTAALAPSPQRQRQHQQDPQQQQQHHHHQQQQHQHQQHQQHQRLGSIDGSAGMAEKAVDVAKALRHSVRMFLAAIVLLVVTSVPFFLMRSNLLSPYNEREFGAPGELKLVPVFGDLLVWVMVFSYYVVLESTSGSFRRLLEQVRQPQQEHLQDPQELQDLRQQRGGPSIAGSSLLLSSGPAARSSTAGPRLHHLIAQQDFEWGRAGGRSHGSRSRGSLDDDAEGSSYQSHDAEPARRKEAAV